MLVRDRGCGLYLYNLQGGEHIKKILIIEDDKALSNGIVLALQSAEIAPSQCFNINSARTQLGSERFDLLILDINLPDGNGLDFLREMKREQTMPVILLTANDLETDVVIGLEMGADDYITKPFSLAVLRARVNTQLRKIAIPSPEKFALGEFVFDFGTMEFFKDDTPIELSKSEQKLLRILLENRGTTVGRSKLVDRIWTDGAEYVDENALSVTIKRLRHKLEHNPSKPANIKTVYGLGYTWAVK